MLKVGAIVCLSSSYAGIFEKTGLLRGLKDKIEAFALKTNKYAAIIVTSVITMAAINLPII